MNVKKGVRALLISALLLFGSFAVIPASASEKKTLTMYFHEDQEDYIILQASMGHLNDTFPSGDKPSDAAVGWFEMQNVSSIDGDVTCKLFFRIPPFNLTEIIDSVAPLVSDIIYNISGTNLSLANITGWGELWKNITNTTWDSFWSLVANTSLSDEEEFTLQVMNDTGAVFGEKTFFVNRTSWERGTFISILENLTSENFTNAGLQALNAWQNLNQKIVPATVTVPGVHYETVDPSEYLVFYVEASNQLAQIREIIDEFSDINISTLVYMLQLLDVLPQNVNLSSGSPEMKALQDLLKVFNATKGLIEPLINISFVYGSKDYPASITFEGTLREGRELGVRKYYLHDETVDSKVTQILDENPPIDDNVKEWSLSDEPRYWTLSYPYNYSTRMHGTVNVTVYLNYSDILDLLYGFSPEALLSLNYNVKAALIDVDEDGNSKEFASNVTTVSSLSISSLLSGGLNVPTTIQIKDVNHAMEVGHSLRLGLSIVNRSLNLPSFNITIFNFTLSDIIYLLNLFNISLSLPGSLLGETPVLMYDSVDSPSNIELNLAPLDDIKLSLAKGIKRDQLITKAGKAFFNVTVKNTGLKDDTVKVIVTPVDPVTTITPSGWNVSLTGVDSTGVINEFGYKRTYGVLLLPASSSRDVGITITPPRNVDYGDGVDVTIEAKGNRGYDEVSGSVTVSSDVVKIGIDLIKPADREARIGRSFNYTFKIVNTGNEVDSFHVNVKSDHDWANDSDVSPVPPIEVMPGEEKEFNVTVFIPSNVAAGTEDFLIVTVSSGVDPSKQRKTGVVTTAVSPSLTQIIGEGFDSFASQLGLNSVLGSSAGTFLMGFFFVVVIIFVVIAFYLWRKRFALLICLDRIKEVEPGEKTSFEVTLKNPTNQRLTYDLRVANEVSLPEGWHVSLSEREVKLDPDEEKKILLSVEASPDVDPDGYTEIKVEAMPREKPKAERISIIAMVKGAKVDLYISNVFHWPKTFKGGDVITTRFAVHNRGNVKAKGLSVKLAVNGVEKNRVENISIPPKGYANVRIPWVASPGENSVTITVEK